MIRVIPIDGSRVSSWGELFARAGSACFCRYWHFGLFVEGGAA